MEALLRELWQLREIQELAQLMESGGGPALVTGLSPVHRAMTAAALRLKSGRPLLMLCADEGEARRQAADLRSLTGREPVLLTGRELHWRELAAVSRQWEYRRLEALYRIRQEESPVIVTTADALALRCIPPQVLERCSFTLRSDGRYQVEELARRLTAAGAAALALFGMDAVKSLYEFRLSGSGHLISGDEDRWKLLAAGVQDFLLHPLFGTGLGNTAHSALAVIVPGSMAFYHNLVAQVIGSMGIVGIFAYGVLIRDRLSLLLRGRKDPFVGAMLLSYLAMLMVSMTNPGEFCPFPNAALMVMVFSMVEEAVGAETVTVTQLRRRGALRGSTGGSYAQYK